MFQVEWIPVAVEELAAAWTQADSSGRQAITEAASTIDKTLRDEPFESSESREDEGRIFFASPLGVLFYVDLDSKVVRVEHVWRYRSARH
ncbi:MAG: hypothetical protein ACLQGP_42105 [Isosphaeraceae bacterium]